MRLPSHRRAATTLAEAVLLLAVARPALADNCGSLSDCYGTIAAAIAVVVAIAALVALIAFAPEILAALGLAAEAGGEAAAVGGFLEGAGPWVAEAVNVTEGGAILQSTTGSCVAACGEMLSGGALTEVELLAQIGEWSNPAALAEALNAAEGAAAWEGGYFATGAEALAAAEQGQMAGVLQAPFLPAHMVVIEPLEAGGFLVQDSAIGGTYEVTAAWIEKFVAGGIW
jgi:hypothetical protein